MQKKAPFRVVKIENLGVAAANFLKQEIVSRGGDAIISHSALFLKGSGTDCFLYGTDRQLELLIEKLELQAFGLKAVAAQLKGLLFGSESRLSAVKIGKRSFEIPGRAYVIGILNLTPDSFYDGGAFNSKQKALSRLAEMEKDGADIVEIGGQSAVPGKAIPVTEEIRRVIPVLRSIRKRTKLPISIDTYRSEVAKAAVAEGADLINDITGFEDSNMIKVAAESKKPVVIMHIKGKPKVAQKKPLYKDLMGDICRFLRERIARAVDGGISRENILIDPGIGFGKNTAQNLTVIRRLKELTSLGQPVVFAGSHKSFIGDVLDLPIDDRLEGTITANVLAVLNGANFVRVHEVKEAKRALAIATLIK